MTAFLPNTVVDIYRGTDTDAWGDVTGTGGTWVARGVPAFVNEDRQRSYLATGQRGGVVEFYTIRFRPGTDVQESDRVIVVPDETTTYQVDAVSDPPGVVGLVDVRCTARRIAATSTP